ncbi:hypothetical protein B0H12DRAFT_144452 [Mycena haematopus]|nr:hypothetical protein B0H12DRAFT_144452 [Mycena haematopus]
MKVIREEFPHAGAFNAPSAGDTDGRSTVPSRLNTLDDFFEKYHLSGEIRQLLHQYGIDTVESLLDVGDLALGELGFKVGHIAELNWALNKTLLETSPTARLGPNPNGFHTPGISGNEGQEGQVEIVFGAAGLVGLARGRRFCYRMCIGSV